MATKTMTTQKKKDLKDQYQVTDLKEYDVLRTRTTAYPTRRVVTGEHWSEKLNSKKTVRSTPSSPIEKVSTSEIMDTEEETQRKRPIKKTLKEQLHEKDDSRRYSMSDIQLINYLLDVPEVVSIQYQDESENKLGAQNVSLQVSLPTYQDITEEAVIEAQSAELAIKPKEQETKGPESERSYVGYYEGTIGLFERPIEVISSKGKKTESLEVPPTWPPKLAYGITPSASSDDDK